jgi:hypothetical protein
MDYNGTREKEEIQVWERKEKEKNGGKEWY